MNAEILCIGTEVLIGDIINTNGAYLAKQLSALGIDVFHQSVVGDNAQRLKEALKLGLSRADTVITTGGLGPTYDDVTKKTVAQLFGLEMTLHAPSVEKINLLYKSLNKEMTPNNLLQAEVPVGATVFFNDTGYAPGIAVVKDGKTVIMLPGPPGELKPMFNNRVMPYLLKDSSATLKSKTVHIFGMGESAVEDKLRDLMTSYTNPTIAPYAKRGEVEIRIRAKAKNETSANALIAPVVQKVKQRMGDLVYGVDVGSLQNAVVQALKEKGKTLATAESCTGGGVSSAITDIAGASGVFECGMCTYSNDMKQKLLGVQQDTLVKYGAVSGETAREMAKGVREISGADIGIGITGIAGPGGGSEKKPVGRVYMAIDSDGFVQTKELTLSRGTENERDFIRNYATMYALRFVLSAVNNV